MVVLFLAFPRVVLFTVEFTLVAVFVFAVAVVVVVVVVVVAVPSCTALGWPSTHIWTWQIRSIGWEDCMCHCLFFLVFFNFLCFIFHNPPNGQPRAVVGGFISISGEWMFYVHARSFNMAEDSSHLTMQRAHSNILTRSLPWCQLKTINKSPKFEILTHFFFFFLELAYI